MRDQIREEDLNLSLVERYGIPRTFKTANAQGGPHVVVTPENDPFPELHYRVIRNGRHQGCVTKIDSRRRTFTVLGLPLAWVTHMESLGYDFNLTPEESERIDIETRCGVVGDRDRLPSEEVRVIPSDPTPGSDRLFLPKSRVLNLNGVEVDFAKLEIELPYDTVMVFPKKTDGKEDLWVKYKDQVPGHWYFSRV